MSTATAQSTIGALFYKGQAGIDFHELAAKLAATMLQNTPSGLHIDNDYDDMVIFDRPDVRIGLAHARLGRDFPEVSADQGLDECFVVSVGHGPEGAGRDDHEEICASLLAQIEERCPAAGEVLLETDWVFDAETVDSLLDETVSVLLEEDEADGAEILPPEEEGEAKGPGVLVLAAEVAIVVE
ncbi:MAG: hypothetical protein D6801_03365 [Alphaproteobacteria bacterium]|nr:MAG: hypothetical protein D6801_03365 [Alphaproteobacteria bacterium]